MTGVLCLAHTKKPIICISIYRHWCANASVCVFMRWRTFLQHGQLWKSQRLYALYYTQTSSSSSCIVEKYQFILACAMQLGKYISYIIEKRFIIISTCIVAFAISWLWMPAMQGAFEVVLTRKDKSASSCARSNDGRTTTVLRQPVLHRPETEELLHTSHTNRFWSKERVCAFFAEFTLLPSAYECRFTSSVFARLGARLRIVSRFGIVSLTIRWLFRENDTFSRDATTTTTMTDFFRHVRCCLISVCLTFWCAVLSLRDSVGNFYLLIQHLAKYVQTIKRWHARNKSYPISTTKCNSSKLNDYTVRIWELCRAHTDLHACKALDGFRICNISNKAEARCNSSRLQRAEHKRHFHGPCV